MKGKASSFIRKNLVYIIIGICLIAIALSITLVIINKNPESVVENSPNVPYEEEKEDEKKDDTTISFIMPVENAKRIENYCVTPVFNSTLNRYSSHLAMDFFADSGTNVLSIADGTILKIENDLLRGITVTIDHGNGFVAEYNSITETDDLVEGQNVVKGQVIGEVSCTNRQEYKEGEHLHFSLYKDSQLVNPEDYLIDSDK